MQKVLSNKDILRPNKFYLMKAKVILGIIKILRTSSCK